MAEDEKKVTENADAEKNKKGLTESEKYLISWFIDEIGDGDFVTFAV